MDAARRGAVRSESARAAILGATAQLFAERGFEHLSIEGIAVAAGVGKQTVYRWWSSKSALVADSLLEGLLLPDRFRPPDTGDLRADLAAWLRDIFRFIADPVHGTLLRSLVSVAALDPKVGERLAFSMGTGSALTARLSLAVERHELPHGSPIAEIGEALVGGLILRVMSGAPVDDGLAGRFVVAVLGP